MSSTDESKEIVLQERPKAVTEYTPLTEQPDDIREIMKANVGSGGISRFDLDKITVPAGGGLAWSVPSLSGTFDAAQALEGIIIGHRMTRAYWKLDIDDSDGNTPPDCSSEDAIVGRGIRWEGDTNSAHDCATCPLSQFGRKADGSAERQPCRQSLNLFLLRALERIPVLVQVPPTSLRPLNQFLLRLASRGIPYWGSLVRLGLERMKSNGGQNYSVIVPGSTYTYDSEARARLKAYVDLFAPVVSTVRVEQPAAATVTAPNGGPTPEPGAAGEAEDLPPAGKSEPTT